jgi:hypothetical protein
MNSLVIICAYSLGAGESLAVNEWLSISHAVAMVIDKLI